MNWKKINEKYPKAFLEWVNKSNFFTEYEVGRVEFSEVNGYLKGVSIENSFIFCNYELSGDEVYKLPHYFDTLGIHIDAYFLSSSIEIIREYTGQKIGKPFAVSVHWDMAWDEDETFPDRLSALKAGVEKAFEIREKQLNKHKQ